MAAASVKQEVESPQEEDCEPPGSEEAVGGTPDAAPSEDPA